MAGHYLQTLILPEALAAQERFYGKSRPIPPQPERDAMTDAEGAFIALRDSFYMATVTSDGWPYVQHRGGSRGFLKVFGSHSLAFADYKGNRQMISTGNLSASDRVSLFLMDYPRRERLKILGHARVEDAREKPALVEQVAVEADRRFVERVFLIDVVSYDWNCPKYITPRFSENEVREVISPLQERIAELEKTIQGLREGDSE
jgi:predicted pyridoxine 5'-phosphate oxidase superfamily flavin-nucleotide-binding protein